MHDVKGMHKLQVQFARSPDDEIYMVVREPEVCKYVITLYHPDSCWRTLSTKRKVLVKRWLGSDAQDAEVQKRHASMSEELKGYKATAVPVVPGMAHVLL